MQSEPIRTSQSIRFGGDFELDPESYKLRRSGRVLKLERIPMEILLFLVEQQGQLVTREQIVEKIWGKAVFLDTDNSINGAIRKIRQVLKDDPEEPRFVQTVTGKGYRFIAPVLDSGEPTNAVAAPTETGIRDGVAHRPARLSWPFLLAGALALLAIAGVYLGWSRLRTRGAAPAGRVMLAVLPFDNLTGDASQEYFSDGLTEEMITQLGRTDPAQLGVISRTSVMVYKHDPKPLDEIGRKLRVQYIIEGSVRRDAERVRITAQLIRVKDQTHVWAREYDRDLKNLLSLQDEITQEIADEIQLALGDQQKRNAARRSPVAGTTTSYEAYDLYLKGRYFWNKRNQEGFQRASGYFQQAIAKDPNYARAYAGLADTFAIMSNWGRVPSNEYMPKARAAALRALQIDETLAEAHTSLALIAESYDYDWQTAEREFRRAIELDPGYATAHQWYAEHLSWRARFAEALAESERAQQLDPLSLIIAVDHCTIYYYSREYDRAIAECRAVLAMDPEAPIVRGTVFYALVNEGKFTEALDEMDEHWLGPDQSASIWAVKAYLYGQWGQTEKAQRALARFEQLAPRLQPIQLQVALFAYESAGRKDQAIALLQKAYSEHSGLLTTIKVDPRYDPLRGDPRFQDLLRRVGLGQ